MPYDVCVIGLGRIGLPLALSFADAGLSVLGVDNDTKRLDMLREKQARAARVHQRVAEHGPISAMLVQLLAKAASLTDVAEVSVQSGDIRIRVMR